LCIVALHHVASALDIGLAVNRELDKESLPIGRRALKKHQKACRRFGNTNRLVLLVHQNKSAEGFIAEPKATGTKGQHGGRVRATKDGMPQQTVVPIDKAQ